MQSSEKQWKVLETYSNPWASIWKPVNINTNRWQSMNSNKKQQHMYGNRWTINETQLNWIQTNEKSWKATKARKNDEMRWTSIRMNEHQWTPLKINEHEWKSMKNIEIKWKRMNIHAKSWQPMKGHEFYGNWWTSMQISGNQRQLMKIHEHQWKSSSQIHSSLYMFRDLILRIRTFGLNKKRFL